MNTNSQSNQQKKAYLDKVQARVDRWDAEISRLEAAARETTADAKIEYLRQVDGMRQKRDEVLKRISDIKNAGTEAWEELKGGVDRILHDIESTIEATKSALKSNK